MSIRRFIILSSAFCSLLLNAASAEQVTRVGDERFDTEVRTKSISLDRIENLSFTASSYLIGKLTVKTSDTPTAKISYKKQLKADSEEMAEEFSEFISVVFEDLENEFAISAETRASPPWRGTDYSAGVEVEIEVPRKNSLKIYARVSLFEIDVEGPFAAADITSNFGDITLKKISGKINVSSDNGAVFVEDCSGPTKVTTSNRSISLHNVDGQLGSIRLRNQNGKIILDAVRGEIDARTEFAQITATQIRFEAGRSTLATENSNIKVDASAISGDLSIRSENGKIDMTMPVKVSAALVLQVEEGGRIYTNKLPVRLDRVSRTLVQGVVGDGQNKIEIDMAGVGTINVEGVGSSPAANP